jgi:vacuolar-type H+-ATPase subunit I/STV1
MDVDNEERVVVDILSRLREMIKMTAFAEPETEEQITVVTEELRTVTANYLNFIYDTNALNRKLMADMNTMQQALQEERARSNALEKKLLYYNVSHPSANINRRHFGLYIYAVHDRDATEAEWKEFTETFVFDNLPFTTAVYKWIDTHVKAIPPSLPE